MMKKILEQVFKFVESHKSGFKAVKAFVFVIAITAVDSFVQSPLASITIGAVAAGALNWAKHNVLK